MSDCKHCEEKDIRIRQLEGLLDKMSKSKMELEREAGVVQPHVVGRVLTFPLPMSESGRAKDAADYLSGKRPANFEQ